MWLFHLFGAKHHIGEFCYVCRGSIRVWSMRILVKLTHLPSRMMVRNRVTLASNVLSPLWSPRICWFLYEVFLGFITTYRVTLLLSPVAVFTLDSMLTSQSPQPHTSGNLFWQPLSGSRTSNFKRPHDSKPTSGTSPLGESAIDGSCMERNKPDMILVSTSHVQQTYQRGRQSIGRVSLVGAPPFTCLAYRQGRFKCQYLFMLMMCSINTSSFGIELWIL